MKYTLHIFLISALMCIITPLHLLGQDSTHVIRVKDITPKKKFADIFQGKFTAAPHYSNEMGLGVAFSYECSQPLTFIGNITSKGYVLIGASGNTLTRNKKWAFNYSAYYNFAPSYYWGTGYAAGNISGNKTEYNQKTLRIQSDIKYRFSGKFSLGPSLGYDYIKWEKFPDSTPTANVANIGLVAEYDSRNASANPEKGIYATFRQRNYTNLSGSSSLQFNYYTKMWKGGILAFDLYTILAYGNTNVTMLPSIGGTERMRGYYYGRYRSNNILSAQIELRQQIWQMIGCAAWAGGATLWGKENKFGLKYTLPNYGAGLRIALAENLRLRLDYGFGESGQSAFIFSINEAF